MALRGPEKVRLFRRSPEPLVQEPSMQVWRCLGAVVLRLLYRIQVVGAHQVPVAGPVILVANHIGFLDGPVTFVAAPRPTHFLVKRSWFDGPLGALLHGCGQVPITQHYGDRQALAAARSILQAQGVLGIFPEGTRGQGDVAVAQQGAAYLALTNRTPIVPVALVGTAGRTLSSWPRVRSRLCVTYGPPFTVHDLPEIEGMSRRQAVLAATEHLRQALAAHVHAVVAGPTALAKCGSATE